MKPDRSYGSQHVIYRGFFFLFTMKHLLKGALTGLAALVAVEATTLPKEVRADPTMDVSTFHAQDSDELKYTVTNTSGQGDLNDMGMYRVPFGSNDGISPNIA